MISSARLLILLSAALAAFAAGWFVNGLIWEARSDDLLKEQEALLLGQCKDQQKTTRRIDNETLAKIRARDDRIAEYRRMHPTQTCVPVARTAGNNHAAGGGNVDARPHAIADHALIDYAAIAERYRIQLIGCQEFINRTWESQ